MQLIVDSPEHNIYSSFVYADAELRESNGGAVVVITVKYHLLAHRNCCLINTFTGKVFVLN